MTVPTLTDRNIYDGTGSTTVFPYTFQILQDSDMAVSLIDADGVETVLALSTDYTVSGAGSESGGNVTFVVAPEDGVTVLLLRLLPYTQPTDYKNQGSFYPRTHERSFDRATMQIQQVKAGVDRSMRLPDYIEGVSTVLPIPAASNLIGWDAAATGLRNFSVSEIGTTLAFSNFIADTFTASAAQSEFPLTADPGNLANLDVSIDGVTQVPGTDYTVAGTTLTFAVAMAGGEKVLARYGTALPTGITDASSVNFLQAGAGSVIRTMQDKARETVSLADFGVTGDGSNESAKVQAALDTGKDVLVNDGLTVTVLALTMNTAGQRIYGGGKLKALADTNGQLLRVLADDIAIEGVYFDGTAAKPGTGQVNDMIRVESVTGVRVTGCRIEGSKGGGIALLNANRCRVISNYITDTNDNGVLVANLGADDNVVAGNVIVGTGSQNCIFLTADSSSLPTTDYIYRNVVTGNICSDATDTGIEVGQHCVDTAVTGNTVYNCANPEILVRDSIGTAVTGNVVKCGPNGSATHDGIAFLEQNETNWDYRSVCSGNVVTGEITRAGILLQGANNVTVTANRVQETVASVNGTTGAGMTGGGVIVANDAYGLHIADNDLRRLEYGVLLNLGGGAVTLTDCTVQGNKIVQATQGIDLDSVTMVRGRISGNTISSPVVYGISNSAANGSNNSQVDGNVINLSGFSGASPVAVNVADWASRSFTEAAGQDSGWVAASFQNGWGNLGGAYQTVAYRKVGGVVYLRGLAAGGTTTDGTSVFTLPTGFRPSATEAFPIANAASPTNDTRIEITAAGAVTVYGPVNNSYVGLSGINFFSN